MPTAGPARWSIGSTVRSAALAMLLSVSSGCAAPGATPDPASASGEPAGAAVAFVDVSVIPMDRERVLPEQTVLVRDGRIERIGPTRQVQLPAGAQVIEARGKFLIPGLAEMHAHIPPPQADPEVVERTLFLYLAGGVTTIRGMLGQPQHLELRERAAQGELLAPRIYTSGPSLNGNSAPTPEAAVRMVEEQHAAGYDFLKLHPGLSRPVFDAMAAAAERVGIPFAGHVSAAVGLERALEAGQATIDHLDGYVEALAGYGGGFDPQQAGFFGFALTSRADASRIPELAQATRAAGVWNVPTQSLMEHLLSPQPAEQMAQRPEMRYMSPQTVAQWVQRKREFQQQPDFSPAAALRYVTLRRQLIKALHDAGAGLLLGSDAPQWWNVPGFSLEHELRMLVAAGLTPYQALRTGTRNPAVFFGTEEWGTIAEGKAADLVLLDANPLQNIDHVSQRAGVMVRGRWLPASEIQRRLDAIAASVRH